MLIDLYTSPPLAASDGSNYLSKIPRTPGVVEIIPSIQGNRLMPSYVAFEPDGSHLVGEAAKRFDSMWCKEKVVQHERCRNIIEGLKFPWN